MPKSVDVIETHVSDRLAKGETIDVYRLAELLQPHCPDLTLKQIAEKVSEAVVACGGSAFWNSPRETQH
jgi:hypothetical protein